MNILSVCSEPKVLEVMRIVNLIISIIRVVVPIILIISLSLKFAKAVSGNGDLEKAKKSAVPSIVAAVLIFVIPSLISLVIKISFPNRDYINCLKTTTIEQINELYVKKADELIQNVEENPTYTNYSNALAYLQNIKDDDIKAEYEAKLYAIKELIDEKTEEERKKPTIVVQTTGYGSNITPTDEIKTACGYIFNEDTVKVQLRTCTDEHQYANPSTALPGGAVYKNNNWYAKETIPFSKYKMGLFFGEIPPTYSTDNFLQTFAVMYKNVILKSLVPRQVKRGEANIVLPELSYVAGSCTQNYRENLYKERYESGKYKDIIDSVMEATKYFILVNNDGTITDVRYNTRSGILDTMKKAAKEGKDIRGMIEAMKSGHDLSNYYKNANVYDCRNLQTNEQIDDKTSTNIDTSNININIIHLGDSRIQAYTSIKSYLGFDENKESIYARYSTSYDDYFKSQMSSAKSELNRNKDKTYAITVNYGVNGKRAYKSFCDYYDKFVQSMDKKHQFYIISVNPFDESKVKSYKDDNTNAKVETFNNYMKDTCINQIKQNSPTAQVFYCDTYGSISLEKWASSNYIKDDGIHYTKEGSKYIYDYTKKCIAEHNR